MYGEDDGGFARREMDWDGYQDLADWGEEYEDDDDGQPDDLTEHRDFAHDDDHFYDRLDEEMNDGW